MTFTNFPDGIPSLGVPMVGGIGGIPFTGNWWFVDAVNGSDGNASAGSGGSTPEAPLQTLAYAYACATEGQNDVIVLMSGPTTAAPTTGTFRLSEQLVWAKSATHLIGMTAPTMIGQRARISTATAATTNIADLIKITAQGCVFANFSIFQGVGQTSTAEQLCQITGQRNYFWNVSFQGMGSAAGAGEATSYCIYLNGGSENTFDGCQIGVDTQSRSAANASIKMRSAATRNIFRGCLFPIYATATSPLVVDAAASGSIDRFAWFKDCLITNFGTSALAAVVGYHASQGGFVLVDNCSAAGCTDWTASDTSTVKISGPVPNGDTSGMMASSDTT